jgi:hypothetical protein
VVSLQELHARTALNSTPLTTPPPVTWRRLHFCSEVPHGHHSAHRRGAEKLKDELQRLKTVERHAVIQAIAEARAQGDLSENAEYEAAKDKQGFIEGRILEIEGKLAAAQIIDPQRSTPAARWSFGSTVDLEEEAAAPRSPTRSSATTRPT